MATLPIRPATAPANSLNAGFEGSSPARPHGADPDRLLTINDVAEWLGVTRKKPFLPCVRLGEITRFRRAEIERFIQEHAKSHGSA